MNNQNRKVLINTRSAFALVVFLSITAQSACSYFESSHDTESEGDVANNIPQTECSSENDCVRQNGLAREGCQWICKKKMCVEVGSCDALPDSNQDLEPDPEPIIDTGCLSDKLGLLEEGLCRCECKDCDCQNVSCSCDLACYKQPPPKECVVILDESGNIVVDGTQFENCEIECAEESDLTEEMPCTLNNCLVPANNIAIEINPNQQINEAMAQLELERQIRDVDVLFAVDNSHSMSDDQMASYCAMDMFLNAASANDAKFDTGVINTDLNFPTTGLLGITNPNSCRLPMVDCRCTANGKLPSPPLGFNACGFDQNGSWLDSSDPNNWEVLKKTIVQGEEVRCGCESGLQQAFRLFARMEINGTFNGPYETVVISDEDADGDQGHKRLLCPFSASLDADLKDALRNSPFGFNPPTPTGTEESCKQDLADFYTYYFKSRNIMVHGLIYDDACAGTLTEKKGWIYEQVIKATNGHQASICDCTAFVSFMEKVGSTTSDMSTQLCVQDFAEAQKITSSLDDVVLYYTASGSDQVVPQNATNGWQWDQASNCFILSGSWLDKMGSFRVEYKVPTQVVFEDAIVCPDDFTPIANSIVVTCEVDGQQKTVPNDDTNGWSLKTIGGKNCLVFTGSWSEQTRRCELEYR